MTDLTSQAIELAAAEERLRQQRETFNLRRDKDSRNFRLRMAMGWTACVMLPSIAAACMLVLYFHDNFPTTAVTVATSTLFVEVVGGMLGIWRSFFSSGPDPVTPTVE